MRSWLSGPRIGLLGSDIAGKTRDLMWVPATGLQMDIGNLRPGTLILRSDASIAMGIGHVMRSMALGQAWQDAGGVAVFAMAEFSPSVRERLLSEGMEVVALEVRPGSRDDARFVARLAQERAARWAVVDGYQFDANYQRELKAAGLRVLFVDDNGDAGHYTADLVLNQNSHADESMYQSREPSTRLLLGSPYVLLRREFEPWRDWKREIAPIGRKVLVTMGGSDPDNITLRVIEVLTQIGIEGLEAIIIVGGSNPYLELLEQVVAHGGRQVHLEKNPADMPDLMAWADIALIVAGGTLWELLFMGCSVLSYARNSVQDGIISWLGREGAARDMGYWRDFNPVSLSAAIEELARSPECRSGMSVRGQERIDGRGAARICELITHEVCHLLR